MSIGFSEVGNPKLYDTKDKLLVKCDEVYSNEAPIFRIQIESQLWRFSREILVGDKIVTYNNSDNKYYMATVKQEYMFLSENLEKFPNTIKVEWNRDGISKNNLSEEIKSSLNTPLNVYQIVNYQKELEALFKEKNNFVGECKNITIDSLDNSVNANFETKLKSMGDQGILKIVGEILKLNGYNFNGIDEDEFAYVIDAVYVDSLNILRLKLNIFVAKGERPLKLSDIGEKLKNSSYKQNIVVSVNGFEENLNFEKEIVFIDGKRIMEIVFDKYDKFSYDLKSTLNLKKVYI